MIALHANKGKTIAQCLEARTDYAKNPEKTEKGHLVTAYQCDPMTVDEEFMLSKRKYRQITGREQHSNVIAYQIRQSFKPGEITPEEANRVGYELAMQFTKGRYAFIVATHTDRAHIHNHIIFNSTALDGTKKFNNFHLSGLALQRLSDILCIENGLSVITPRPRAERKKRSAYPARPKHRDTICMDIDQIMGSESKPKDLEQLLQALEDMGYEVKQGKHISVRGKNQKRFLRLSSLPEGYREAELRAVFTGGMEHRPRKMQKQAHAYSLIIDIQEKLRTKGPGYARWASVHNLKQMSAALLFLRDHNIDSMEQLNAAAAEKIEARDSALAVIQASEKRLEEIAALKKAIINYSKTRAVYEVYRKKGYSKRFLEEHREEITLHRAAKKAFDDLGVKRIPKVKDLSAEYEAVLAKKREAARQFRSAREEMKEYLIIQSNISSLYEAEAHTEEQAKKNIQKQMH